VIHRRRRRATLALSALLLATPGCMVHEHRVGAGPAGVGAASFRQYYLLFGLMQINDVDVQRALLGKPSFAVTTSFGFTDFLLTTLLAPLTVCTRSVGVEW
jgi:hypothetical protein